jgi:hypothetical protein
MRLPGRQAAARNDILVNVMKRILPILALSIIFSSLSLWLPAQAQSGGGWSPPIQLSGDYSSWFPDIAVDPEGGVHVVWSSGKDRPNELYDWDVLIYRVLRGGVWSPPNDIASPGAAGSVVRNSIVMGRDGRLHLLQRSDFRIDHMSAPYGQAESAADWTESRRINRGDLVYYDELAVDGNNRLHAVWTEQGIPDPENLNKGCPLCSDLYYRYSDDGGAIWSVPVNISEMPDGSDKPHIQTDQLGRVHIAWDEGNDRFGESDPKVGAYRRSDDGGVTWKPTVLFSLPNDLVQQTTLGLLNNTTPIVIFRSTQTDAIYYQIEQADGQTWGQPIRLASVHARSINDPGFDHYTMVTDGQGSVHLLMSGFIANDISSATPRLLHLTFDGQDWSAPEVVATDGLYPEWPSAVVENGNVLHLVWFTRSAEDLYTSDNALYKVWYSRKELDLPAVAPGPLFTPTPTSMPTAIPQPTAQPTPFPTLDPTLIAKGAVTRQPKPEGTGVSLLFLGGIPAVTMAFLVWIARRIRR